MLLPTNGKAGGAWRSREAQRLIG